MVDYVPVEFGRPVENRETGLGERMPLDEVKHKVHTAVAGRARYVGSDSNDGRVALRLIRERYCRSLDNELLW